MPEVGLSQTTPSQRVAESPAQAYMAPGHCQLSRIRLPCRPGARAVAAAAGPPVGATALAARRGRGGLGCGPRYWQSDRLRLGSLAAASRHDSMIRMPDPSPGLSPSPSHESNCDSCRHRRTGAGHRDHGCLRLRLTVAAPPPRPGGTGRLVPWHRGSGCHGPTLQLDRR